MATSFPMNPTTIQLRKEIPGTHFFVYKSKQYPFNMELFKLSSNYFSKEENNLGDSKCIDLVDQNKGTSIDINDESINDFVHFIQRNPIQLHNQNIIILNYLGHRFEIDELIESTEEYISNHHSELSLEILIIQQENQSIDTSLFENTISDHFLEYIKDDRILKFTVPTLYRIIKRYNEKQGKTQNQETIDQIFTFLLKCLDNYGKTASVLFSEIEFDKIGPDHSSLLMTKYSKVLDFHFINPGLMKSLYERESEILRHLGEEEKRDEEMKSFIQNSLETIKSENETKFNQLKKQHDESLESLRKELAQKHEDDVADLKQRLGKEEAKNKELEKKIGDLKGEIERLQKDENEKMKKEIDVLKQITMPLKIDYENELNATSVPFDSSNRFNGIIAHLGNGNPSRALDDNIIDIVASSIYSNSSSNQPKNVLNQNENDIFQSKNEPNSWLYIDFRNHRVNPSHYSIKSNGWGGKGHHHLKSWDIDGSNDLNSWDPLDSRRNETSLDNRSVSNTFNVTNQTNSRKYYQYLRIMQKDKNTHNDSDRLIFGSIEFFGKFRIK